MRRHKWILVLVILLGLGVFTFRHQAGVLMHAVLMQMTEPKTIADRLAEFGAAVHDRLAADFARTRVAYPPKGVVLLALKEEKQLEAWVTADGKMYHHLRTYPIRAASGKLGPKLREGDHQAPEGIYRVESLNPNSRFHVALRLDYPNAFDREKARIDGRDDLGGDIMVHGKAASIGCLAMGDEAAEDLFVLAAETGIEHVDVVIAPVDFRTRDLPAGLELPGWAEELYGEIKGRMRVLQQFPVR